MELNEWSLIFVTPVQALSAIAIAVLAFFTFRLNRSLAKDNRRLIKTQLESQVVAYLAQEKENGSQCVFANVENIGRGPAQNVRGELKAPGKGMDKFIYNKLMERAQGHFKDLRFLPIWRARPKVGAQSRDRKIAWDAATHRGEIGLREPKRQGIQGQV